MNVSKPSDESYKPSILVVDDDEQMARLMEQSLKKQYQVQVVNSGEACRKVLEAAVPDVILLDVVMPDASGFDICKELRKQERFQQVIIIFVTSFDGEETFMQSFRSGGNDFVTKPFNVHEIKHKIGIKLEERSRLLDLKHAADQATDTAMSVIADRGDLGVVIDFLSASFECQSYESLAELVLKAMKDWGLHASVRIVVKDKVIELSWDRKHRDLEFQLLRQCHGKGSIIQMNRRLLSDSAHVSIYVPNLPEDDDIAGRIRDNIRLLINGANSRAVSLELRDQVNHMFSRVDKELKVLESRFKNHSHLSVNIIDQLLSQTEQAFCKLGMSEEQEAYFIKIIQESTQKLVELTTDGTMLDRAMESIIEEMEVLTMLSDEENQAPRPASSP